MLINMVKDNMFQRGLPFLILRTESLKNEFQCINIKEKRVRQKDRDRDEGKKTERQGGRDSREPENESQFSSE